MITSDNSLVIGSAFAAGAALSTATATGYAESHTPPYVQADGTRVAGLPDPITEAVVHPGHAGPPVMALGGNDRPDDRVRPSLRETRHLRCGLGAAGEPTGRRLDLELRRGRRCHHLRRHITGPGLPTRPRRTRMAADRVDRDADADRRSDRPRQRGHPHRRVSDGSIVAAYNESPYASGCTTGQLLRHDAASGGWSRINGPDTGLDLLPVFGLEVDSWGVLYAATDNQVFVADGPGQPWHDSSTGLPRRVHLGHLRFARYPNGGIALIAATWGRSAWKATWYVPASMGRSGRQAGPGLSYNRLIGSLIDGRLYQVTKQGLHPVGPIDPELQRNALASGAALTLRVGDLHAQILHAGAELGDGPDAPTASAALATVEALHNQLARGLATLAAMSEAPQSWPLEKLQRASLQATADVVSATSALTATSSAQLPAAIKQALHAVTGASATHAAAMATIEKNLGLTTPQPYGTNHSGRPLITNDPAG